MINQKWIELLTEGKLHKIKEFDEVARNSKSTQLAIMKYRRLEMDQGRGQNITADDLVNADETKKLELLQELFLEPIADSQYIKKDMTKIHEGHMQNQNKRFLNIALLTG